MQLHAEAVDNSVDISSDTLKPLHGKLRLLRKKTSGLAAADDLLDREREVYEADSYYVNIQWFYECNPYYEKKYDDQTDEEGFRKFLGYIDQKDKFMPVEEVEDFDEDCNIILKNK